MVEPSIDSRNRAGRKPASATKRLGGIAAGTQLLTPSGYRAIETLRVGDSVATLIGQGPLFVPITWVGRRSAARSAAKPIRIKRDAIGTSMPIRDIVLAPDQALYVGGVLHRAADLVNGITIQRASQSHGVEYWCVSLQRHTILVAENLSIELPLDAAGYSEVTEPYRPTSGVSRSQPKRSQTAEPIDLPSRVALSIRWLRRRLAARGIPAPTNAAPAPRQSGRLLPNSPELLNLETEARAAVAGLVELAATWHVRFEVALQPDLMLHIAPRTLHEVLDILLVHAMEATAGGKVLLGTMRHHERVHVAVIDDGAGRDVAAQRADLRRVEEIIALLGGKLEIESRAGEGTTILLRLPGTRSGQAQGE